MAKTIKFTFTGIFIILLGTGIYFFSTNSLSSPEEDLLKEIADNNLLQNSERKIPPVAPQTGNSNATFLNLIAQADQQIQNREFNEAIQTYLEIYQLDPSSNTSFLGVANIYFKTGRTNLAIQNLEKALKKGPLPFAGELLNLKITFAQQDFKKFSKLYEQVDGNSDEKLLLKALDLILKEDLQSAELILDSLATSPSHTQKLASDLKFTLATYKTFVDAPKAYLFALTAQKLLDNEEILLSRPFLFASIKDKNDYKDAWLMLGYSYLLGNSLDDSVKSLEKAKQISPYDPDIYFYLGLAQQKNSQLKQASDNFKSANAFGFRNKKDILLQTANSLYLNKDFKESLKYYQLADKEGSLKIEEYTKMVWISLEATFNFPEALESSLRALQVYPTHPMANNLVGWAQSGNNNFEEALKYFDLALQLDPNLEAVYFNLGKLYYKQQNYEDAANFFQKAKELAEQNKVQSILDRSIQELSDLQSLLSTPSEI